MQASERAGWIGNVGRGRECTIGATTEGVALHLEVAVPVSCKGGGISIQDVNLGRQHQLDVSLPPNKTPRKTYPNISTTLVHIMPPYVSIETVFRLHRMRGNGSTLFASGIWGLGNLSAQGSGRKV
eukprot:4238591-Pyramimonas_sp.AAC.1